MSTDPIRPRRRAGAVAVADPPAQTLTAPVRNRYFYGKLLDVRHLEMEQRVQHHTRAAAGTAGRSASAWSAASTRTVGVLDGRAICIAPWFAIDGQGREIVVGEYTCIDDPRSSPTAAAGPPGRPSRRRRRCCASPPRVRRTRARSRSTTATCARAAPRARSASATACSSTTACPPSRPTSRPRRRADWSRRGSRRWALAGRKRRRRSYRVGPVVDHARPQAAARRRSRVRRPTRAASCSTVTLAADVDADA